MAIIKIFEDKSKKEKEREKRIENTKFKQTQTHTHTNPCPDDSSNKLYETLRLQIITALQKL